MNQILMLMLALFYLNNVLGQELTIPQQICRDIAQEMEQAGATENVCTKVRNQYAFYLGNPPLTSPEQFNTLCSETLQQQGAGGTQNTRDFCEARTAALNSDQPLTLGIVWNSMMTDMGRTPPEPSGAGAVAVCSGQLFDNGEQCLAPALPISSGGLADLQDLFAFQSSPINIKPYSPAHCECLESEFSATFVSRRQQLEESVEAEKRSLNQLIFQAAGQKLLNNFAGNLEDIRFYLHNKGDIFGVDAASAMNLQCNKAEDFQREIDAACAANQVSKSVSDARMGWIMNSLGDSYNASTLQGKFNQLEQDILNIPINGSRVQNGHRQDVYTREEYDRSRYSVYRTMPEVQFFDSITFQILHDRKLRGRLEEAMESGKSPGHAIMNLLKQPDDREMKNLLERLLRSKRGTPFYDGLAASLRPESSFQLEEQLMKAYRSSINAHPGIKAIFSNTNLFKRMMMNGDGRRTRDADVSILGEMETHPEFIRDYFTSKCDELKKHFAEAACNKGDNYIANTSPNDLNALLAKVPNKYDRNLKDLILCRQSSAGGERSRGGSIWTQLNFSRGDSLRQSDFLDRKLSGNQQGRVTNAFSLMAQQKAHGNSALTQDIERQNKRFASERVSVIDSGHGSVDFYRGSGDADLAVQKAAMKNPASPAPGETKVEAPRQDNAAREMMENHLLPQPTVMSSVAAQAVASQNQPDNTRSNNETRWRDQIREYLSEGRDSGEIDRHLANTNSRDMQELARLREEVSRDREKMLELVRENDRQRISSLESTYRELETRYNNALKAQPQRTLTRNESSVVNELSNQFPASQFGDSLAQDAGRGYSTSPTPAAAAGRSSVGGIFGGSNAAASSSRAPASATRVSAGDPSVGSSGGAIVVSSNSGRPSQDMNQEIMSLVNSSDDVQVLRRLKENGMVYKYKVVENGVEVEREMRIDYSALSSEVKQILDQKIASREQFLQLEQDYLNARRTYSFSTLKMILGIQAQRSLATTTTGN